MFKLDVGTDSPAQTRKEYGCKINKTEFSCRFNKKVQLVAFFWAGHMLALSADVILHDSCLLCETAGFERSRESRESNLIGFKLCSLYL